MSIRFYTKTGIITGLLIFCVFAASVLLKQFNEKKALRKMGATVIRVVDGDTVVLDNGQKVRLLGIDAPETNHPDRPVQKYGQEAKNYLKNRVEGKKCVLEYTLNDRYDVYDRLLALIYADGGLVNAEMVKKGLAYASPNKYMSATKEFLVLENIAKKFKKGIWETETGGQAKR
jgi:micrococcal nuclease